MSNETVNYKNLNLALNWKKVCALLLCFSAFMASVGYLVQTGTLSPEIASDIVLNWNAKMDNFVNQINELRETDEAFADLLYHQWNPTLYSTQGAYCNYAVYNLTGAVNQYYVVQNVSQNGNAWTTMYSVNFNRLESNLLGNLTGHSYLSIWLCNMAHDYSVTVPEGISVVDRYNGLERTFINIADLPDSASPITVYESQTGYYHAKDSENHIFVTDTNKTGVLQTIADLPVMFSGTLICNGFQWDTSVQLQRLTLVIEQYEGINYFDSRNPAGFSNFNMHADYDFLIYSFTNNTGVFYAAKSGENGKAFFESTDVLWTLNETWYNLPQTYDGMYYGVIKIAPGDYISHTTGYTIPNFSSIELVGSGKQNTRIIMNGTGLASYASDADHYVLTYDSPFQVFDLAGALVGAETRSIAQSITIKQLSLDTRAERYMGAVLFSNITQFFIDECIFNGFYAGNTTESPVDISGSDSTGIGLYIRQSVNNRQACLDNTQIVGYSRCLYVSTDHLTSTNCQFKKCYMGCFISSGWHLYATNWHFFNNRKYGIYFGDQYTLGNTFIVNPNVEGLLLSTGAFYYIEHFGNNTVLVNPQARDTQATGAPLFGGVQPNATSYNTYYWLK